MDEYPKLYKTFTGHAASVAFSPNGSFVVSGSRDNSIRLWNLESGTSRIVEQHDKPVNSVAFSPDGSFVVSGSWDKTIRLWHLESKTSTIVGQHDEPVMSVAFSPDGQFVASGAFDDHTIKLWQILPEEPWRLEMCKYKKELKHELKKQQDDFEFLKEDFDKQFELELQNSDKPPVNDSNDIVISNVGELTSAMWNHTQHIQQLQKQLETLQNVKTEHQWIKLQKQHNDKNGGGL